MFCRYRSDNKEDGFQDFDDFIYPGGSERLFIFLFLVFLLQI